MESEDLFKKYVPVIRKNLLPIVLGLAGLIFFVYGLISLSGSSGSSDDITFSQSQASENKKTSAKIKVDIEGAVVKPGVYSLNADSRIQDALVASSGLSEEADRNWISKNLNLAAKLSDGVKIYIPKAGENVNTDSMGSTGSNVSGQSANININSASATELDTLYGVGPVTAQKIISNRPYSAIEELVSKKAVSSKVFEQIKDKITIY